MKDLQFRIKTTYRGTWINLPTSPEGYDESQIAFTRSKKYYGITRIFTIPLKFIREGATYVREEFYNKGTGGEVLLEIRRLDRTLPSPAYNEIIYAGTADMSTFVDNDQRVSLNFTDGGLSKDVATNMSVEYDITTDVPQWYMLWNSIYTSSDQLVEIRFFKQVAYALIDKMTGGKLTSGQYLFKSDLLDGMGTSTSNEPKQYALATGRAFRYAGSSIDPSTFKTSFADFWQSLQFKAPGMSVERDPATGKPQLRIESFDTFFDDKDVLDLGTAKALTVSVDSELSVKSVRAGFPAKDREGLLNSIEVIGEGMFQMPNRTGSVELDLVAKYRADIYGIWKIQPGPSQDDSADEDIWICSIYRADPYPSPHEFLTTGIVTNLQTSATATVQNADLSPRNVLLNNRARLSSHLYLHPAEPMVMTSASKNIYNLSVYIVPFGPSIDEKEPLNTVGPVKFIPLTMEADLVVENNDLDFMNLDARRQVKFSYLSEEYFGYILEAKINLLTPKNIKIKLLADRYYQRLYKLIR